ncbi:hypothetical protein BMR02_11450 [Methylococcaceae bacterium HT1]|nr:hypothetical protein BMR02_11450 [Methylococcaceae bacterium HT1]TXK97689.1 hypothetical protein BMR10_04530 [Methylococcaceae bacterium CS4]TXK99950.1 hypothetical protein BMR11_04850 [Methylococcaceae bacterium CS5]TXL06898.1 hypothetical protein BMR07_06040 [Methylococcaceae bacterium CS1]TXL07811.1 hypothetical protein BMR09_04585 [Methylococcaceae bacterium CS3]TXL10952.1 hypothetical protein BMR08_06695 [Methylococcaceae bacterium CS2]TXL15419.1 hypothetical protein BMR05_03635 [Meth
MKIRQPSFSSLHFLRSAIALAIAVLEIAKAISLRRGLKFEKCKLLLGEYEGSRKYFILLIRKK